MSPLVVGFVYLVVITVLFFGHRLLCHSLHRSVLWSASPPFLLSKREEAVLHIFNDLHNYHITCTSLLDIFENSD
jgi:hypothetical protein